MQNKSRETRTNFIIDNFTTVKKCFISAILKFKMISLDRSEDKFRLHLLMD